MSQQYKNQQPGGKAVGSGNRSRAPLEVGVKNWPAQANGYILPFSRSDRRKPQGRAMSQFRF